MKQRGRFQGVCSIVRFNWPYYLIAVLVLFAALVGLQLQYQSVRWLSAFGLAGSSYFILGSLGVSHLVYDRSDLYRWKWLDRALKGATVEDGVFCHSGFDETSIALKSETGVSDLTMLDHYDRAQMTEASIRRARSVFPPVDGTLPCPFDHWPIASESVDVVFGVLAIHELRSEAERIKWFKESSRCLKSSGRVVIVEHTRDFANFLAFGPGFLHFHSPASWARCWKNAGLGCSNEFRVTPWIRVFILTHS